MAGIPMAKQALHRFCANEPAFGRVRAIIILSTGTKKRFQRQKLMCLEVNET